MDRPNPILGHYTRVITLSRLDASEVDRFVQAIDGLSFPGRAGNHPMWEAPPDASIGELVRFFVPTLRHYFDAASPAPPVRCRFLSHQLLANVLKRVTIRVVDVEHRASMTRVELYAFDTGVICGVSEFSAAPGTALDDVVALNYAIKNTTRASLRLASDEAHAPVTAGELENEGVPGWAYESGFIANSATVTIGGAGEDTYQETPDDPTHARRG